MTETHVLNIVHPRHMDASETHSANVIKISPIQMLAAACE